MYSRSIAVLAVVALMAVSEARICGDVRVRNTVAHLIEELKDCTVVTGVLQIALFELTQSSDFIGVSFPKLEKVFGFLVIHNVVGLEDLGSLLPNLKIIKGYNLFDDFALILDNLPDLKTIGLQNLQGIENGSVRIEKCPQLCFADTIDWDKLGTKLVYIDPPNRCIGCDATCKGRCWSQHLCQNETILQKCDYFEDEKRCVPKCPEDKYILKPSNICITKNECMFINSSRSILNDSCVSKCPPDYIRRNGVCYYCKVNCTIVCNGTEINSLATLEFMEHCTHINGSLILRIESTVAEQELEKYLGKVRNISHFLKIYRSPALRTLLFFKSLSFIEGNKLENRNALIVLDNHYLIRLWNWNNFTLKVLKGNISFHYNHRLCFDEIRKFSEKTRIHFNETDVSSLSNGDQSFCHTVDYKFKITATNTTNITLEVEKTNNSVSFAYYKETDAIPLYICDDHWKIEIIPEKNVTLKNLKPYTNYTLYFKFGENQISKFYFIRTLSDDPSAPQNIEIISNNSTSMTLFWSPPELQQGILDRYVITGYVEQDSEKFIDQRNFCRRPQIDYSKFKFCPCDFLPNLSSFERQCQKLQYPKHEDLLRTPFCAKYLTYKIFEGEFSKQHRQKRNHFVKHSFYYEIPATENSTIINNLEAFSIYIFLVSACNENRTDQEQCSEIVMVYNRTLNNLNADDIENVEFEMIYNNVNIIWYNPAQPNSIITNYEIHYKHIKSSIYQYDCITRKSHEKNNFIYKINNLSAGEYNLKIRAVSLAGPGNYINKKFSIAKISYYTFTGISIAITFIITGLALLYLYCKQRRNYDQEKVQLIHNMVHYQNPIYAEDEWEIKRSNIQINQEIGQGTYGQICNGFIISMRLPCAIKILNIGGNDAITSFLNEANLMKSLSDSHHVMRLLGVVSEGNPLIITELMLLGDLKSYLRSTPNILFNDMSRMAIEIADGMMYLQSKNFIHRNLSARSCMLSSDRTVKIGNLRPTQVSVRWLAPESLIDATFSMDSDVWSYGVLLWEITTLGTELPYKTLTNEDVYRFVTSRGTLKPPVKSPELLAEIMENCWKWHPKKRPTFTDIINKLENSTGQDFRMISFYHSKDGEEYRRRKRLLNPPPKMQIPTNDVCILYDAYDNNIRLFNGRSNDENTNIRFPVQF